MKDITLKLNEQEAKDLRELLEFCVRQGGTEAAKVVLPLVDKWSEAVERSKENEEANEQPS